MIISPPSSLGTFQSIVTVSVDPSYVVVGVAGVDGIVEETIDNSVEVAPVPIEFLAETLNLYVVPAVNPVFV